MAVLIRRPDEPKAARGTDISRAVGSGNQQSNCGKTGDRI
jgi:hypothetical protein